MHGNLSPVCWWWWWSTCSGQWTNPHTGGHGGAGATTSINASPTVQEQVVVVEVLMSTGGTGGLVVVELVGMHPSGQQEQLTLVVAVDGSRISGLLGAWRFWYSNNKV